MFDLDFPARDAYVTRQFGEWKNGALTSFISEGAFTGRLPRKMGLSGLARKANASLRVRCLEVLAHV
jgi:hypothetical protein